MLLVKVFPLNRKSIDRKTIVRCRNLSRF